MSILPAECGQCDRLLHLTEKDTQISFTILSLLINPQDRVALRLYLGCDSPTFLSKQYRILMHYCMENNMSPFVILTNILKNELKIKGINSLLQRFTVLMEILDSSKGKTDREIFDMLFPENDLKYNLIRSLLDLEINPEATFDIKKVFNVLTTYITQPEIPLDIDYVRIMSLHKSKGLTSKVVIITSCIEGLIPIIDYDLELVDRERMLKEQRRLFYVGLTRSRDTLVISSFSNIYRALAFKIGARIKGWSTDTISSRLLNELGPTSPKIIRAVDWQYS